MPGHLDRRRASQLMEGQGLAAIVLCQPESITYATGALAGVASYWRRAGAAFVVLPADQGIPPAAIVGDLQARDFASQSGIADVRSHRIWVETGCYPFPQNPPLARSPRPAQFDLGVAIDLLRDVLAERSLLHGRVGLELGFVPAADFPTFGRVPVTWIDCTRTVEQLRSIKSPAEIALLRAAAEYAGAGMVELFQSVKAGMEATQMAEIWRSAAVAEARSRRQAPPDSAWAYIAVAGDGFAPGGAAGSGDIIKIDVGCVVGGYSSDGGRTAVLGAPHPQAVRVYDSLRRAFDIGFALLRPGMPLSEIYYATARSMWNDGFDGYGRGHFGHGVGASIWSEEWPFISAHSEAVLEPGMVLAFETPWYIDGLGGFIIEDQVLVTESSCEAMSPLPRHLHLL